MISITIQDSNDSRLLPYRCLKGKVLEKDGIFMAEGEKVVKSMMESGCRIASCLMAGDTITRYKSILAKMKKRGLPSYIASDKIIESIIGFRFHRGIMAIGYCPKKLSVSTALKKQKRRLVFVALDAVNDPENVGLIVRNAAAFGVRALIVNNATYDPYYRRSVRVSMGAIFGLQVYYEDDLASSLMWLKKNRNVRIIAAIPAGGAIDIAKADFSGNICLVFGNEDKGVSRSVSRICDAKVRIPISKTIDSLNVASASAVFLHEAFNDR
ncbi:MAG: RNA methyltransferase [Candidatus Omnitrophota bacterium]